MMSKITALHSHVLMTNSQNRVVISVLALHEILHETKIKRKAGVVIKFDFKKAYDKVSSDFLLQCLEKKVSIILGVSG
jgi:hypothetical protein